MKKLMYLGLGLAMLNLTSCKKGDNDPGMSLKGRKGRLAGEWTLITSERTGSGKDEVCDYNPDTQNYGFFYRIAQMFLKPI